LALRELLYAAHTSSAPPRGHDREVKGGAAPSDERSIFRVNIYPSVFYKVLGLLRLILYDRAETLRDSVYLCDCKRVLREYNPSRQLSEWCLN
jgi:hypothetical protein